MEMYFNGISNALSHGIEAIFEFPEKNYYLFTAWLDFDCTNNLVEYEACVMGLWATVERKGQLLKVYRDSALVIYQLHRE